MVWPGWASSTVATVQNVGVRLAQAACPQELLLVVTQDAQGGPGLDHVADDPEGVEDTRPAVDEVAEEDRHPAVGVAVGRTRGEAVAVGAFDNVIAKLAEERLELVGTAVDVADDVERAVEVIAVVPQRAFDDCVVDLVRAQDPDVVEALLAQARQRAAQALALAAQDVRPELAVGSRGVALLADPLWDVERNRDRQRVVTAGKCDQRLPCLGLHVGRVDDRQSSGRQPLGRGRPGEGDCQKHL
jgi:hypothetical protein